LPSVALRSRSRRQCNTFDTIRGMVVNSGKIIEHRELLKDDYESTDNVQCNLKEDLYIDK
jgi:hypothetical protein